MSNKTRKLILRWILLIFSIFITLEIINISTDIYNFKQLKKVQYILKDLSREDKQFLYLKDFNTIYNSNIKPLRNCYYIRNYISKDRVLYTFWFKLYSITYKLYYLHNFYVYPKYDIPYSNWCIWWQNGECFDINRRAFENIISSNCEKFTK